MSYLKERSIIGFGFLIISQLIFYYELHPKNESFDSLFFWKIMNFYSISVIIAFIIYLFCNLDWFDKKYFLDQTKFTNCKTAHEEIKDFHARLCRIEENAKNIK